MNNFEFHNPVKIIFGKDQITQLPRQIDKKNRVLLIYGGGSIRKNGVYDQTIAALAGYTVFEFAGIEPNPRYETCLKAVEFIHQNQIDFLLAIGGGSVIDATKFIAAAACFPNGDPWTILANRAPIHSALPFGCILTLPSTGSEMNSGAVITRQTTSEKFAFGHPLLFPRFSILLPEAAATLPRPQVANGVVDAFVHTLEQYITYPADAPLQDRLAEGILLTLIEQGPKAYANPADYSAMSSLMWCATMALNGLIGSGVPSDWATHMIGHELTALHEIDHARTLAIVLPGLWRALIDHKTDKLAQYGQRVWGIQDGTPRQIAEEAILRTEEFFHSLDIPTRLSDYSLGQETVQKIVSRLDKRGWSALGDRRLATPDIIRQALSE